MSQLLGTLVVHIISFTVGKSEQTCLLTFLGIFVFMAT